MAVLPLNRDVTLYYASIGTSDALSLFGSWAAHPFGPGDVARRQFEAAVATALDSKGVFLYGSARSAIMACLQAIQMPAGAEVLVTGFTCLAVPLAVVGAGATPVYVDIDGASLNAPAEATIAKMTPSVRAVIVQHTFGNPAPADAIVDAAHARGIRVIEDCAVALGSTHRGRLVGSFGDAAVFSLELSKTITTGWGGVLAVRDGSLAETVRARYATVPEPPRARVARMVWQTAVSAICHRPALYPFAKYVIAALFKAGIFRPSTPPAELEGVLGPDFLHKLSGPQAALGLRLWHRLPVITGRIAAIGSRLRRVLRDAGFTALAEPGAGDTAVAIRVPFPVRDPAEAVRWFADAGIELGRWFDDPLSPRPRDERLFSFRAADCPVGAQVSRHVVNLPSHARLSDSDVEHIERTLAAYVRAHSDAAIIAPGDSPWATKSQAPRV